MDPALRLYPGQQELTPAQEAEARRFAEECIQRQLSTAPVDEQEAERLLRQVYALAQLPPPQRIEWLDGPLQLFAVLAPPSVETVVRDRVEAIVGRRVRDHLGASVGASVDASIESFRVRVWGSLRDQLGHRVKDHLREIIWRRVWNRVKQHVGPRIVFSIRESVGASLWDSLWDRLRVRVSLEESTMAYQIAPELAYYAFLAVYLAPNDLQALAQFNELVSGYWLGSQAAVLVRRPNVLSLDTQGRLHNANGKCLEYRDGWGLYAWQGSLVPEKVILAPETLTREDFLNEWNVERRRILQERMGSRFLPEVGGKVINRGPRGVLYQVKLPGDPERRAHYVQVEDASTGRQYYLRVPPTIHSAAEAVAWSFGRASEEYHPADET